MYDGSLRLRCAEILAIVSLTWAVANLFLVDQSDAQPKGHPEAKHVSFCWDKEHHLVSQVAGVNVNPPISEETRNVDPGGIWTIVIMLDSRWFKGP